MRIFGVLIDKLVRNRGESMYNFLDRFTLQKVQLLDHIHNEKRFFSSQELAKKWIYLKEPS